MRLRTLLLLIGLLNTQLANAVATGEMVMIRSSEAFPETMAILQEAIHKKGYSLSRVQRVDVGLTAKGYKTDKYRVVFFGKGNEIQELSMKHPEIIAYLPLKIAIYAEGDNTILITSNPMVYNDILNIKALKPYFKQWQKDVMEILKSVQIEN